MKVIQHKIDGKTLINNDTHLLGMIAGNTIVSSGITFNLDGTIIGNLILEKDSIVNLCGTVNGNVSNNGGSLNVYGTVNGVVNQNGGDLFIHPDALVQKVTKG